MNTVKPIKAVCQFFNQFRKTNALNFLYLLFISLFTVTDVKAGTLTNSSVSVSDLTIGATATYTISFTPDETLDALSLVSDQFLVLTQAGGPDFSGAVLQSVSGGTLTANLTNQNTTQVTLTVTGGQATSADTVIFIVSNVINPGALGSGPNYIIRTADFFGFPNPNPSPAISDGIVAGSIYTASNAPVVVNPIADQNLSQSDGPVITVNDLDSVFEDADGVLSFVVDSVSDTNVISASISGSDALTLTPNGSGSAEITITASSGGQSASDTFNVQVIGQLSNLMITPQDLDAGASTSYEITFSPSNQLQTGQIINLVTGLTGPDYTNATLTSISGGSVNGQLFQAPTNQSIAIEIISGSANSSNTITLQLADVINPGAAGQGPEYSVSILQLIPFQTIDLGTALGSVFGAVGIPTVIANIADQNLAEEDGVTEVVNDLNTIFTDGDGDPLTFSIETGHDTNVATASVSNNALMVTPTGPGTTTITVKASDLPGGEGEVTTSFVVNVVGIMDNASWTPQSFDTLATTSYDMSYTASSPVTTGQFIIISNLDISGPDYSTASFSSINGGSLVATIVSQNTTTISFEIISGSANPGDTISISIDDVNNPNIGGLGPDYQLRLFNLIPTGDVERVTLVGTQFIDIGLPTVTGPIADQVINQVDGSMTVINDLNTVFTDGNGDNLTFSVLAGSDVNVAIAEINNNQLTITPVGSGTTTFMIEASDLLAGGTGTVIDAFDVRIVGELSDASITPASLEVSALNNYAISFTPAGNILAGDVIEIRTQAGGPDFSLISLNDFNGGTMTVDLISQNPLGIQIQVLSGSATSANSISFNLDLVMNPLTTGTGADYDIEIISGSTILDETTVSAHNYIDSDLIFNNGFDPIPPSPDLDAKAHLMLLPFKPELKSEFPFYDALSQQYEFLHHTLSRDDEFGIPRNGLDVVRWFEQVLILSTPNEDWDDDGLINWLDSNPLGIKL